MKHFRLTIVALIAGIIAVASANAQPANRPGQQTQATTTATAPTAQQGSASPAIIAVINTAQFEDQQRGLQRIVAAYQTLQREFQPRSAAIQQQQQRLETLAQQIQSTANVARPEEVAQRRQEAERLQLEITRAREDAQAAYNRRLAEVLVPVNRDIATSLETFARARGITIVFDIARLGEVMFITSPALDITTDFIADYNRRNPAAVAAPTTAPTTGAAPGTTAPARTTNTPTRRP